MANQLSHNYLTHNHTTHNQGPVPIGLVDRGDGWFSPIVALDELPSHILLRGLPHLLRYDQIEGIPVVYQQEHAGYFTLISDGKPAPAENRASIPGSVAVSASIEDIAEKSDMPSTSSARNPSPIRKPEEEGQELGTLRSGDGLVARRESPRLRSPAAIRSPAHMPYLIPRPLPPSGIEPDPSKKEYCTYWLRHGACDFFQQGCRYKHEIPTTKQEWARIGLRSIPDWIRELAGRGRRRFHRASGWPRKERQPNGSTTASTANNTRPTGATAINSLSTGLSSARYSNPNGEPIDEDEAILRAANDELCKLPAAVMGRLDKMAADEPLIDLCSPSCSRSASPATGNRALVVRTAPRLPTTGHERPLTGANELENEQSADRPQMNQYKYLKFPRRIENSSSGPQPKVSAAPARPSLELDGLQGKQGVGSPADDQDPLRGSYRPPRGSGRGRYRGHRGTLSQQQNVPAGAEASAPPSTPVAPAAMVSGLSKSKYAVPERS